MDCRRVAEDEVAEAYLAGRLAPVDQEAFEQHYFACDACLQRLQALQAAAEHLRREPQRARTVRPARSWVMPSLASAAALLTVGLWLREAPAPPPALATNPPVAPTPPALDLTELGRIEPPAYAPRHLRGPSDAGLQAAMARYAAGDYTAAHRALDAVVAASPGEIGARFFLGVSLLLDGRWTSGAEQLERVAAAGPSPYEEQARFFLAKARLRLADLPAARAELERVVALRGERESEARVLLERLASGR